METRSQLIRIHDGEGLDLRTQLEEERFYLHGRIAGDPAHRSGPALALYILHRVRDALYVAQDVSPGSVLAEYVQNLQQLLTVEDLPGTTFVDPSRVKVRVLSSAGTAGVHLTLR